MASLARWPLVLRAGTLSAGKPAPSRPCSASSRLAASTSQPPRFYIPTPLAAASQGALLRLPADEARHATKTLRLRPGDVLELCDGHGWLVRAELAHADRGGAAAQALEAAWQAPRAGWHWDVACACGSLKGGRSDWLVEKCAELGAAALTPLLTERSPVIGGGAADDERRGQRGAAARRAGGGGEEGAGGSGREARWERVAAAAMKQCLRPYSLHIARPLTLQQLCERVRAADAALVAVAGAPPLAEAAARLPPPPPGGCLSGVLCVGPEGDWTQGELEQLMAAGAQPVGLGPLRLRAETAAVSLLACVRMHTL